MDELALRIPPQKHIALIAPDGTKDDLLGGNMQIGARIVDEGGD